MVSGFAEAFQLILPFGGKLGNFAITTVVKIC